MIFIKILFILLFSFSINAESDLASPEPAVEQKLTEQRLALEQRVLAKWDALIRKDFATAYQFTSPNYRELFSLLAFKRNFSVGKVEWQKVEVEGINFNNNDTATVNIKIYIIFHQTETGRDLPMSSNSKESWIKVNEQWWYVMAD